MASVSVGGGEQHAWVQDVPGGLVVLVGADVVAANAAAGRAFGGAAADLLGPGLLGVVADVQRAAVERALLAAGADGSAATGPGQDPQAAPASGPGSGIPDGSVAGGGSEVGAGSDAAVGSGAGVDPEAGAGRSDGPGASDEGPEPLLVACGADPVRYVAVRLGPIRSGVVVASVEDVSDYIHAMMLLAYSANTTMVVDQEAQILWGPVGRYAAQEMGSPWYGRGEASPFGWLHPEDIGAVLEAFTHVIETPGILHELTVRTRHVILEDQWGVASIRAINLLDDDLVRGILVQTQAEGIDEIVSLGRTTGSFQSIAEAAPIGIILSDHLGRPLYWNDVARQLFDLGPTDRSDGATEADVDWPAFAHEDHVEPLRRLLDAAFSGGRGSITARFDTPGGERWLAVTVAPQVNDKGEPMGWLATLQDMTREKAIQHELEAARERLTHLAGHDPLTGLANRRLFAEQLHRAIGRMGRDGQQVALLFCDLDDFKPVNDSFGHDTGDVVLTAVAERMRAAVRTTDLVARLGGDEFVVLVEGFGDRAELTALADRLIAEVDRPVTAGRHEVTVGISVGLAVAGPSDTADSLLSRADDLMYQAKAAGRGRYVLDPSP